MPSLPLKTRTKGKSACSQVLLIVSCYTNVTFVNILKSSQGKEAKNRPDVEPVVHRCVSEQSDSEAREGEGFGNLAEPEHSVTILLTEQFCPVKGG